MKFLSLVYHEILHRKTNFLLSLLSVTIGVGSVVGALVALHGHDLRTEQILNVKQEEVQQQMNRLEDDFRKITKNLGFNILILPKDQNLSDLYAEDFASNYMPEEYVTRLAHSKIVTINHLMPSLQHKVKWPEQQRTIMLFGVRGEVPILYASQKSPMMENVTPGSLILGYELHRSLNKKPGEQVQLMGKTFSIQNCYPERGNKDDITAWVHLSEAQQLLGKEKLINGILALECNRAMNKLSEVRAEISKVLPDTQVIEFASQAIARAEARKRATLAAEESLQLEQSNRMILKAETERFAANLVPLIVTACALSIGFLALSNVRERKYEIGIFRALGMPASKVLLILLSRPLCIGLIGALCGCLCGLQIGSKWGHLTIRETFQLLSAWQVGGITLVGAPFLAFVSSWIPIIVGVRQDPAVVLREVS